MPTDARYRLLFENSPDAILLIEGDLIVDCNMSAAQMLRFPTREALLQQHGGAGGAHPAELSPPCQPDGRDSREKADEILERTFREGSQVFEWVHACADGEPLLVEVQLTVLRRSERPIIASVWRDIGERKRLEAARQEASRLEAVGRLAGGIAHDFNNLLVVIMSNAEFLMEAIEAGRPDAQDAKEILEASHRASDLTRQLLAFSRGQVSQSGIAQLDGVVGGLMGLIQRLIGEHIELEFTQSGGPLTVLADPIQIEQIVLNLAANARDAMPEGGMLSIDVRPTDSNPSSDADREDENGDAPMVTLAVRDTGHGMSPAHVDHAFDPFFSTKPSGGGTGLGLATVRTIVQEHDGEIAIETREGEGTLVSVSLPRVLGMGMQPEPPPPRPTKDAVGKSILFIEDEAAIRNLMARELRAAGYRVSTAVDGRDALDRLEAGTPVDLLVTDVVMPRMSGPEFARRLQVDRPNVPVLFVSGYSDERDLSLIAEMGNWDALQKPFSPAELRAVVADILARQQAAEKPSGD